MLVKFLHSESGASLVEYAVALVVVTIVGGVGVVAVAGDAAGLTELSSQVVEEAHTETDNAIN